jgi:uncharacterized protein YoxC
MMKKIILILSIGLFAGVLDLIPLIFANAPMFNLLAIIAFWLCATLFISQASLAKIEEAMQTIDSMSTQIATAVEEQTHVTEEVNKNVTSIVQAIQASAENANETASAMQSMSDSADSLEALLKQFKLN